MYTYIHNAVTDVAPIMSCAFLFSCDSKDVENWWYISLCLTYFTVFIRNCFIKPNEGTFHNNDIMENYSIADHNMVFSEA
jgi:hypothetical protein